MKQNSILYLLLLLLCSSCSYKLISRKAETTAYQNGELLYYLPKTLLYVKAVYIKSVKIDIKNGIVNENVPTYTVKSVEISPFLINDKSKAYTIKGGNGNAFLMAENFGVKFNQYGVVQSMQTTLEDKTLETIENTLKGVASIASVVAILGDGDSELEKNISAKIDAANIELANAIDKNDDKTIKKIKIQLLAYYELLKQYYENNKTVTVQSELTYEFIKEPELNKEISLKPIASYSSSIPDIAIKIWPVPITEKVSDEKAMSTDLTQADGLIYCVPEVCHITATVNQGDGNQNLLDNVISLPQFGRLGVLPITSKVFTSRRTTIEFDPATGTLVTLQRESGSSSENLSKSFATTADLLKSTVTNLRYDQRIDNMKKDKEIKELKESMTNKLPTETERLQETVDILKLNFEVERLKKELVDLQKETK